jgi:hypothetical protein
MKMRLNQPRFLARIVGVAGTCSVALAIAGCSTAPPSLRMEQLPSPAPTGSIVPQVYRTTRGAVMSWLEPRTDSGYAFRMASHHDNVWSDARTIADSPDLIMFSADLPGLAEMPGGSLLAYWQRADRRTGDPYATAIQVARSTDEGHSWSTPITPHRDGTAGQHGFISAFPASEGIGLVWLDAQQQQYVPAKATEKPEWLGAIGLRATIVSANGDVASDQFIDPITCECCPTAAAATARGPVVVYRDRVTPDGVAPKDVREDSGSVRDIHLTRLEHGQWTAPKRVHADNWIINACPDNGPAVDARGERLVVAWWTAANNRPHVSAAFSSDAGDSFTAAIPIDAGAPNGQVTVALMPDGRSAVVGWQEKGQTWARWVSTTGAIGQPLALGTSPGRSRLPRWIAEDGDVLAVWTADDKGTRMVRVSRLVVHD